MPEALPVYHPRDPTQSPLWNILHNNYEEFKANYDESYEKQYGFFRLVIDEVVQDYLKCGDLKEGFARVRCTNPDCRQRTPCLVMVIHTFGDYARFHPHQPDPGS